MGQNWGKYPHQSRLSRRSDNTKMLTKKLNSVISLVQDFSSNPLDAVGLEEMVEEPDVIEDEFLVKYVFVNCFLITFSNSHLYSFKYKTDS